MTKKTKNTRRIQEDFFLCDVLCVHFPNEHFNNFVVNFYGPLVHIRSSETFNKQKKLVDLLENYLNDILFEVVLLHNSMDRLMMYFFIAHTQVKDLEINLQNVIRKKINNKKYGEYFLQVYKSHTGDIHDVKVAEVIHSIKRQVRRHSMVSALLDELVPLTTLKLMEKYPETVQESLETLIFFLNDHKRKYKC